MEVSVPTTKELTIREFLKEVEEEIRRMDEKYSSAYELMKDAMQGAVAWAPQAFMQKQIPDISRVYTLSVQLLAICYATERARRKAVVQ